MTRSLSAVYVTSLTTLQKTVCRGWAGNAGCRVGETWITNFWRHHTAACMASQSLSTWILTSSQLCRATSRRLHDEGQCVLGKETLGLLGTGKFGGQEFLYLTPTLTLSPPEWFCIKAGRCVGHFNVFIVWAKSQDSVHKPQFLKRRERRAEADPNQGPSAYQPSALPLGHTGSHGRAL